MIVIADTGPVNYLILIGEIDILPALFQRVLVPPSVCEELKWPRAPDAVRIWIAQPPVWLEIRTPGISPGADLEAFPASAKQMEWIFMPPGGRSLVLMNGVVNKCRKPAGAERGKRERPGTATQVKLWHKLG